VGLWVALGKVWYQIRVQLPLKVCLCFVFRFEVLQQCNFLSLFLLPFQQGSHILDWFFWWVPVRLKKINGCHFNLFLKKVNSLFIIKKWIATLGCFEISIFAKNWLNKWPRGHLTLSQNYIRCQLVRHIRGQSYCHSHTFHLLTKRTLQRSWVPGAHSHGSLHDEMSVIKTSVHICQPGFI